MDCYADPPRSGVRTLLRTEAKEASRRSAARWWSRIDAHVQIAYNTAQVGVTVAEDFFGNRFYNVNHDADLLWQQRKARLLPGLEARDGEPPAGSRMSRTESVDGATDGFDVAILDQGVSGLGHGRFAIAFSIAARTRVFPSSRDPILSAVLHLA